MMKESIFNKEKRNYIGFGQSNNKTNTKLLNQKFFLYIAKR